jgi:hypothetical protein
MADLRHCDRAGCEASESCASHWFLTISHQTQAWHFCSWACLATYASAWVAREQRHEKRFAADVKKRQAKG